MCTRRVHLNTKKYGAPLWMLLTFLKHLPKDKDNIKNLHFKFESNKMLFNTNLKIVSKKKYRLKN
jgi:hypothetical protein